MVACLITLGKIKVFADRGFQNQDILAPKDVTVNMPEFLKNMADQLDRGQLERSKTTSSKRIHIERVIGFVEESQLFIQ